MAISISKMINEVASNKYNKTNILLCFLIMIILSTYYTISPKFSGNIGLSLILGCVIFFISAFIIGGYYVATSNNEIHNKKSVFPSFSFDIINKGFIYTLGSFLIGIILYIIPFIIMTIGTYLSTLATYTSINMQSRLNLLFGALIATIAGLVIILVLAYYYFLPLTIQYLISLKFEDFFNFKKAAAFRNNRKGLYRAYFWKSFLLIFLYSFITNMLFWLTISFNQKLPGDSMFVLQIIMIILMYNLIVITIPNLTGQLVHQTNSKIKTTSKQNTSINQV